VIVVLLALLAAGGWAWTHYGQQLLARAGIGGNAAAGAGATTNLAEPAPAPAGPQQLPPLLDQTAPPGGQAAAAPAAPAALPAKPGAGAISAEAASAEGAAPAGAQASTAPAGAQASAAPAAQRTRRPRGPRVRYVHSENMRLFCAGAGKSTPQCRSFRANTRRR
jgi:hypothetical protein